MLVCSVVIRPKRFVIVADVVEATVALDANTTGNIVFATLVDAPAAVDEIVDAFLGQVMLEAAAALDTVSGVVPGIFTSDIDEAASAADTQSVAAVGADTNAKLLMGFNGTDGSTGAPGMTDESSAIRGTATVVGNAKISTAQFKFGASSLLLDGVGDYLTFPDSADWDFGTGQFTLEGFFRFNVIPASAILLAQWPNGFAFWFDSGALYLRSGGFSDTALYPWTPTLNQWYHIAIDRDASSVARVYVDGVMRSKKTGYTANLTGSTAVLAIGSLAPGGFGTSYDLNAYVDEIRVSNVARYASDAGFTVPTSAFPR